MAPRRLHIKTYGCQMNVYDSERMAAAFAAEGYETVDGPAEADLVILNTCHIREKAAEKMYSDIGRLRPMQAARRATGAEMIVAVAGCVAQAEGAEIIRRAPTVGLVVGAQAYHRLPQMVARVARGGSAEVDTEFPVEDKFDHLPQPQTRRSPAAFLTVQEGCDKFCAFCVVPYTRGAEVSRPPARLIAEARDLVARGVREITLLGQNVNAYRAEGWGLAQLIGALAGIEGLVRLRYTTSHPNDMGEDLIAAHRDVPALMPYLHLPVQSGSDSVLRAMNRRHTAAEYLALLDRIRAARPDIALSGDFITGFPGETDADFDATLRLARAVGYAHAFAFKYSPRPGTPAAGAEQVPEAVKAERLAALQDVLAASQRAHQTAQIGRATEVLVEREGRNPGQLVGKSPYLQGVHFDGPAALIGQVVPVEIIGVGTNSLAGRRLE